MMIENQILVFYVFLKYSISKWLTLVKQNVIHALLLSCIIDVLVSAAQNLKFEFLQFELYSRSEISLAIFVTVL